MARAKMAPNKCQAPMVTWLAGSRSRLSAAREASMTSGAVRERANEPEDLGRLFLERANAGDVDGLVALYEPDAVLAAPSGEVVAGADAIREVYAGLLASRPAFEDLGQRPALRGGDLALTSSRVPGGGATAEVARRQPDGTWLWMLDQSHVGG